MFGERLCYDVVQRILMMQRILVPAFYICITVDIFIKQI